MTNQNAPVLYIYSATLEPLGVVDEIESMLWVRRFREPGEMSVECPYTEKNVALLKRGNMVIKAGTSEARRIDQVRYRRTPEDKEVIQITGFDPLYWAAWRMILHDTTITGTPWAAAYQLLYSLTVGSSDSQRNFTGYFLSAAADTATEQTYTWTRGTDGLNALTDILTSADAGYVCTVKPGSHRIEIHFRPSVKKTAGQTALHPVIFSSGWGSLGEQSYTEDDVGYKNVVYTAWQPPDVIDPDTGQYITPDEVPFVYNDLTFSGVRRRELIMPSIYADTLPDAYAAVERELKLSENAIGQRLDGVVDISSCLRYKTDFDVGDRVTVVNKRWDLAVDETITEITENFDNGFLQIEARFGSGAPKVMREIVKNVRRALL